MSYQQTTFIVNELIAEPLSDALMAHGALSAAIEDAYAGTDEEQAIFGEPGIESEQIWHNSKILALFDEKADVAAIVAAAAEAVEIPPPAHQIELLPEQDWVRLTQAQFDPIKISDRLWITPSWHEAPRCKTPSICNWTPAWLSARAATPPPACACNGWITT